MFTCEGNICRSPLAQSVFQHIVDQNQQSGNFLVDSSGTSGFHVGEHPDSRMQKVAGSHGITMLHRAKQLKSDDVQEFDFIFAMDKENYHNILRLADSPELKEKIYMFREFDPQGSQSDSVPDPYYGGVEGFKGVFQIVSRTSQNIFDKIIKKEL